MRLVSVRLFHLLILDPIRFIGGSVGVEVERLDGFEVADEL